MFKEGKKRRLIAIAIFIIVVALVAFWFLYQPIDYLKFSALDVGQGDAELIVTPRGQTILVDGGPDNKIIRRLSEELPFWQRRIDLVVLTHPHDDHFRGLIEVFKRYQVNNLILTGIECFDPAYEEFIKVAQTSNVKIFIYNGLDNFMIDGLNIASLYPRENIKNKKYDNSNNSSIVLKLSYNKIDFLLMGDAETLVEQELLFSSKNMLNAEVLKVAHHGAETSSGEDFLKVVKPTIALISVASENDYGHPSPRILKRLARLNIKEYLTKDVGTIHLKTNGQWLKSNDTCLIADCPL